MPQKDRHLAEVGRLSSPSAELRRAQVLPQRCWLPWGSWAVTGQEEAVSGLDLPPRPSRSSSAFPLCHGEALLSSGSGSCQNLCLFPFLEAVWGRGQGQQFQPLHRICPAGPLESEPLSLRSSCRIPASDWLRVDPLPPLKQALGSGRHRAAVGQACLICYPGSQGMGSARATGWVLSEGGGYPKENQVLFPKVPDAGEPKTRDSLCHGIHQL